MPKFYIFQFALDGDKLAIPNPTQGSGTVSYEEGFGSDYQLDLLTDPTAKAFPRAQYNQFCYDVTDNIRQYQTHGAPEFISSSDNGGTPFSYDLYARVRYDPGSGVQIYESQVAANVTLPTDPSWLVISGNRIPTGVILDYAIDGVPDAGFLQCQGTEVSRTTYAALYAIVGNLYGAGNGSTTFNIPDLRRRVRMGLGGSSSSYIGNAMANIGGSENVTLGIGQIPSHAHPTVDGDPEAKYFTNSPHSANLVGGGSIPVSNTINATGHAGGGGPHPNLQPSMILNPIIKT